MDVTENAYRIEYDLLKGNGKVSYILKSNGCTKTTGERKILPYSNSTIEYDREYPYAVKVKLMQVSTSWGGGWGGGGRE